MSLTRHYSRRSAAVIGLTVVLTSAGCDVLTQTAGGLDELTEFRLVEEVRAGNATDPDRGFSRAQNAFRDRHGRIYAFDAVDTKIKVFNPNGEFRHAIGRRGQGPGEFSGQVRAVGIVGDTIWVSTPQGPPCQSSISLFNLSGEFLGSSPVPGVRVQLHEGIGVIQPGRVRPDGSRISQMSCFTGGEADVQVDVSPNDTLRVPVVLFDLRGTIIDTLGWDTRLPPSSDQSRRDMFTIEGRNHPVPRPPSSAPFNIIVPDGRLHVRRDPPNVASDGELRITALSFANDTLYSVSHRYTARPYSGPVLDSMAASSAEMPGGSITVTNGVSDFRPFSDPAAAAAQIRSRMSFPEFQPPVRGSFVAGDGSVWLSREDDGGPTTRWDIFDSRGRAQGQVRLPRGGRLTWSDGETVLLIEPDENDVPWLVSYRFVDRQE